MTGRGRLWYVVKALGGAADPLSTWVDAADALSAWAGAADPLRVWAGAAGSLLTSSSFQYCGESTECAADALIGLCGAADAL